MHVVWTLCLLFILIPVAVVECMGVRCAGCALLRLVLLCGIYVWTNLNASCGLYRQLTGSVAAVCVYPW